MRNYYMDEQMNLCLIVFVDYLKYNQHHLPYEHLFNGDGGSDADYNSVYYYVSIKFYFSKRKELCSFFTAFKVNDCKNRCNQYGNGQKTEFYRKYFKNPH